MGYAAYREHPGRLLPVHQTRFQVLDVTVPCTAACGIRRALATCPDAGVLRCEPLLHEPPTARHDVLRVRLAIRLPALRYAQVLHLLLDTCPTGEIGRLIGWREHLDRCHPRHAG